MNASPSRIVPHTRPLYFHDGRLFCARFDRIYSTPDCGRTFTEECRLELELPRRSLIGASFLAQRVARAAVYRMRVLPGGNRIFVFRGGVYMQRSGCRTAVRTYAVTRGSRPVSLAVGADGLVVFGEYWQNPDHEAVRIHGSRTSGETWEILFTFAPGQIRHVHGISYDRWEDCFWICTGDSDSQCQLLRASPDFHDVRVVRQGGQGNRFYSLLVTERELITATDTPLEENHVCVIDKATGALSHLARIENTSFYGCSVNGKHYVSTNAEPSPINDMAACHVWMGGLRDGWRRILSFPVDLYTRLTRVPGVPNGLFQYPQFFFPEGDNPTGVLVGHATGLRGLDGAMLCYDSPS